MPAPKVTVLGKKQKINPIVRTKDNTDILWEREMAARAKHSKIEAPVGTLPGSKTTAPPHDQSPLPG